MYGQSAVPWMAESGSVTLAASASYSFTVQSGGLNIQNLATAQVSCGANTFTISQSQNGTPASSTPVSVAIRQPLAPDAAVLHVTAWKASNVGAGSKAEQDQGFTGTGVIVLVGKSFAYGSAQNYTVTVKNTGLAPCALVISVYGVQLQ